MLPVPTGKARPLPKIQAAFEKESPREKQSRQQKRDAVKKTFVRCWESYKTHAWMSDEVAPISGRARNPFGGWGATLVDSLDTLWIMGMRQDFEHAVAAAANISFETVTSDEINDSTRLPGMWPLVVNARDEAFNRHNEFTLGAMSDSTYEYLPKTYALSGGRLASYRKMYEKAAAAAMKHNFFRPMIPDDQDILISAMVNVRADEDGTARPHINPEGQHLVCFVGGMFAIAAKLFDLPEHPREAQKLVDGCIWTYQALPLGIMPETFHMIPCPSSDAPCPWNETLWRKEANAVIATKRLPKGFTNIGDTRYILRPEAIESKYLLDAAWTMWKAIEKNTRTALASAALADITVADGTPPPQTDSMESFWMGETLKYFYLIFSDPDLISLGEFVFNTEAHPFRIQTP
ncbi:glycoside hydrolase [Podospora aff. communis PSN243]|uniref:alpha-1,2-Mannosidase n=1 Tax=Podospora aff. communis PSN243 TaxID=3040156 RepID=A0AAV9FVK3_9PEZI|nr:glycoside hydrolase [Podospora aff. communis PSN243]